MKENAIWENEHFFLLKHDSILPWVKLFTKEPYKELHEVPFQIKMEMFGLIEEIELLLIDTFLPDKINIASFGNQLPHLHWHIIARFNNDPYFPNTPWQEPLRKANLALPSFDLFVQKLQKLNSF